MGELLRETGCLEGRGGVSLFYRAWVPAKPTGSIVLVHGASEHSGYFVHVAEFFASQGLAAYAIDHRGHGQSGGPRIFVERFSDYLEDLRELVRVASQYGKPTMLGHSMGGLISFRYAVAYPETIQALVLTSPWFDIYLKPNPVEKLATPFLSRYLPSVRIPTKIKPHAISRDKAVCDQFAKDPLVAHVVTPRWFIECTGAAAECPALAPGLTMPVLYLHAGGDLLTVPEATQRVYEATGSERKAFKLYPGLYHHLLCEPEKAEILTEILAWLKQQELVPATQ